MEERAGGEQTEGRDQGGGSIQVLEEETVKNVSVLGKETHI